MHLEVQVELLVQSELLLILHHLHLSLHQAEDMVVVAHQVQLEDREVQEVHQEELETQDLIHL